jgi:hypothetical protein
MAKDTGVLIRSKEGRRVRLRRTSLLTLCGAVSVVRLTIRDNRNRFQAIMDTVNIIDTINIIDIVNIREIPLEKAN